MERRSRGCGSGATRGSLEPTSVELLDSLLPQVASSVHRALLDRRAKHDALTGLADRGVLEARLEAVFTAIRDEGGTMAVIMCDLDRFKKVNDTYGHDVGDRALLRIAEVLEKHRRETDLCCRYGGEEFAVVLDQTNGETAQRVAERLRLEVQRTVFTAKDERVHLRLSAGIAAYPELFVKDGKELLVLADEALRMAKSQGRNRSLLHLGRGKYRKSDGTDVGSGQAAVGAESPDAFRLSSGSPEGATEQGDDRVDLEPSHPHQQDHQGLVPTAEEGEVLGWSDHGEPRADIAQCGSGCGGAGHKVRTRDAQQQSAEHPRYSGRG